MKYLVATLWLASCAPTAANLQVSGEELATCPMTMTADQRESGVLRCRDLCTRYGRKYDAYDAQCRCRCQPAAEGQVGSAR